MESFDVIALGELLIDFTDGGLSAQGNPMFEANPGGAPCNVLAMLKKLGKSCAFIGKVGEDIFGRQLLETVRGSGIDTESLIVAPEVRTTLAIVKNQPNGDRDFSFYRHPGADMMLRTEELPVERLRRARIFHFGTLSMTHPGVREATRQAVSIAASGHALISFDPNLRPPLWDSLEEARRQMEWGLAASDIVKISDNEVEFLTGETDYDRGAALLLARYPNLRLLTVTAGANGSYAYAGEARAFVPSFLLGGTIETTGAGDTFCACVLGYLLEHGLAGLDQAMLTEMLRFANAAAYLVTTKKGAIRSMPERAQVEGLLTQTE